MTPDEDEVHPLLNDGDEEEPKDSSIFSDEVQPRMTSLRWFGSSVLTLLLVACLVNDRLVFGQRVEIKNLYRPWAANKRFEISKF